MAAREKAPKHPWEWIEWSEELDATGSLCQAWLKQFAVRNCDVDEEWADNMLSETMDEMDKIFQDNNGSPEDGRVIARELAKAFHAVRYMSAMIVRSMENQAGRN